jgi:exopolysaccharide biosynthesis WecB/TagA/CpsF family protein
MNEELAIQAKTNMAQWNSCLTAVSKAAQPVHAEFLGLRFCLSTLEEVVCLILDHRDERYSYVVTPNAPHVVTVHEQPDRLLPLYRDAWLSLCDSQIIRALAGMTGLSLPLVTGSDLVAALLDRQNRRALSSPGARFLVVGPDAAAEGVLCTRYPAVAIDVLPAPSQLAKHADRRLQVANACIAREWDILLLCVGCPAQEQIAQLIAKGGRETGVALCVGAAVDFITGHRTRAPRAMQALGLEWAYRLALEPRRLWRRYLVEAPRIAQIFLATQLLRRQ